MSTPRPRLDQLLVTRGLAASRSRAADMVRRGRVQVNGRPARKPGEAVPPDADLHTDDPARAYVSRAALKLVAGLDAAGFDVSGREALDLGASTGGFTQVLLERGADHVTALDVGHGQLDASLRKHSKVTVLEHCNARHLTADRLRCPPTVVVSDMSFVSLRIAAEPALLLAAPDALAVLLVKPQFEVGRDGIGKNGLVRDAALIDATLAEISAWFVALPGWRQTHFLPSPITGGDGNVEYLLCGVRDA